MSYRTLNSHPLNASVKTLLKRGAHIGLGLGAFTPVLALANPSGGQVVAGQANITAQNANNMVIHQGTQSAIIDWQQFNIGAGQYVQFLQPSSSSVVLNRVVGGSPTSILGNLTANGQVFLVNTNGVYFAKGASIDAQGFLASTLDIRDSDFLAHNYQFGIAGSNGATVVNEGSIKAHNGGYVVLAGDYAQNTGIITAQSGHVILAAGSKATLSLSGNQLVNFAVNQATLASYVGVSNSGSLIADGGTVVMTADVANALKATVVNNSGLVEAKSMSAAGGHIYLTATGGNILNSGTINASAGKVGAAGGDIVLKGDGKTTLTEQSKITATGNGAHGGHLELSGTGLSVRGTTTLGKGGDMLLDPGAMHIVTGSINEPGTGGNTTSSGYVGVDFIQNTLGSGVDVTIQATHTIDASGGVTKIKSTNAAGDLTLKVASGGTIDLHGVAINIGGNFTASGTGGEGANMSFGQIVANSISLHAISGAVHLAPAVTVSGTLKPSLKATGNISISAAQVDAGSSGSLNMQATNGDILLHATIDNNGNVNLTGSGEGIGFYSGAKIISTKNITLKGSEFFGSTAFSASAEGNLTVNGDIGFASSARYSGGDVNLTAGKTITVDHGIYAASGVNISGQHLNYTGAGNLVISAGYGNITLGADIGSAGHAAGFGVQLVDHGYGIYIDKSIYTSKAIVASQSGFHSFGGPLNTGVFVAGSNAITLSAQGKIKLQGETVHIGGSAAVAISADDGKSSTHGDTLTISGSSTGTGNAVTIGGMNAIASNHSQAGLSVDHSVSLEAGQDVVISGPRVHISGGEAIAVAHSSGGGATALNTVDITAGNDIDINGGNSLTIKGGEAIADAFSDSKSVVSAKADASITLNAGHDVNLSAGVVDLSAGYAYVTAYTVASHQKVTATANTSLAVTAGHNITVSAGTASLQAGDSVASEAFVGAAQKGAKATGTARADLSLDAASAVSIKATANMYVDAGYGVAGGYGSFAGVSSGSFHTGLDAAHVEATGQGASAKLTATANVNITAGAGGIKLTGGNVGLSAGYGLARGLEVSAGTLGGNAAADTQAHVSLTTTGAIKVRGSQISVDAGYGVAASFFSVSVSHGTLIHSDQIRAQAQAGAGGTATLSADASVNLTGGTLSLAASNGGVNIEGGESAARGAFAGASGAGGVASVNVNTAVNLKVSSLTITATNGAVILEAGARAAEEAIASAGYGAVANLAADGGVHVQAQGAVKLTATGSIEVEGSDEAASQAKAAAVSSAAATLSGLSNVSINAGTGISMTAGTNLYITASDDAAYEGVVTAAGKGATAALSGDTGVSLTAGTNITLKAAGALFIEGSEDAAESASVNATAGGNAKLTGLAGVRIKAGGDLLASAGTGNLSIDGGENTGYGASASASNGVATITADAGVHIAVGGAFTAITGKEISIFGGSYGGYGASATAKQGGTANIKLDASVDISAKSIALTAGSEMSIFGGYASVGAFTEASGSNTGVAAISTIADVSFTATGGFTATAGTNLYLYGGYGDNAYDGAETAKHHGKASLVTDTGVTVTADTVALAAGNNLHVHGQSSDLAYNNHAFASDFGQATVKANGGVDITAVSKFSAVLTGSASNFSLEIHGGSDDAYLASASAQHHGVASILADESVNIDVTGAGGTITLSTGKQLSPYLSVGAYDYNAYSAQANASHGGAATVTANASVNLSAKGNVSLKSVHGDLSIYGGYRSNGYNASASAGGDGATAKLNVDGSVNISGANVAISAGTYMELYAGYSNNGRHSSAHRGHAGSASSIDLSGGAVAKSNATASVTVDVGLNIKASGKFTGKASGMSLYGGYEDNGYGASASADHGGKATYNVVDGFTLTAGGAVSLTAVSNGLSIYGGYYYNGQSVTARADNGAVAAVNVTNRAVITAGGAFTANAADDLSIYGNNYYEVAYASIAANHGAKASAVGDGSVSITGTSLSLTAGTSLRVNGGTSSNGDYAEVLASNSGSAAVTALAGVKLTATTGNVTAKAGTTLRIYGGSEVAESDSLRATHHGVASLLADTGVTITGNQVNLTASGSALDISAGDYAGYNGYGSADDGGVTTETAISRVSITAKSGFTATLKGSASNGYVNVNGGEELDSGGTMHAISGAKTTESADASVNINAGTGSLTVKLAGTHSHSGGLSIYGGSDAAEGVDMTASDGAAANVTTKAGVNLTAGGDISITDSTRYVHIDGGANAAYSASVSAAGTGTKAQITGDGSVNIKAGGAVSVNAGTDASIYAGNYAAYSVRASADSAAVAAVTGISQVNITAGTTFTAKAGDDLSIYGALSAGRAAEAEATGAAASAKVMATGSVNVKAGGAVALTAGTGSTATLQLLGRTFTGASGFLTADSGGAATLAATSKVAITAGGALTATAGGNMYISGGDDAASHANLNGDKGTAKETADASVALTAKGGLTLTLHGHDLNINGGSVGGRHATVGGSGNGKATLAAVQSVTLSATGAFLVNGANNVNVLAGVFAATGTDAAVSGGAADSATVNSGITVKGSSVTVHKTGTKTVTPVVDLVAGGLAETGDITVIGAAHLGLGLTSFTPHELGFDPMGVGYSGMMGLSAFGSLSLTANAGLSVSATSTMVVQGSSASALSGVVEQGLTTPLITVVAPKLTAAPAVTAPVTTVVFHPNASLFSKLGSDTAQVRVVSDGGICRVGAAR